AGHRAARNPPSFARFDLVLELSVHLLLALLDGGRVRKAHLLQLQLDALVNDKLAVGLGRAPAAASQNKDDAQTYESQGRMRPHARTGSTFWPTGRMNGKLIHVAHGRRAG